LVFFIPLGLVGAGSVFAFAALPQQMGGLVSLVTVLLMVLIDRLAPGSINSRLRGAGGIVYFVCSGILYVGSLVLAVTVARDDLLWLAALLAVLVFASLIAGAWIPDGRPADAISDERSAH